VVAVAVAVAVVDAVVVVFYVFKKSSSIEAVTNHSINIKMKNDE
jgi:hypothetical protein